GRDQPRGEPGDLAAGDDHRTDQPVAVAVVIAAALGPRGEQAEPDRELEVGPPGPEVIREGAPVRGCIAELEAVGGLCGDSAAREIGAPGLAALWICEQ